MQFTPEHEQFRKVVATFVENEINPYVDKWEKAKIFPAHELFPKVAEIGGFGLEYDEEYGGQGADHTYTLVLMEELGRADAAGPPMGISVQATMSTPALHRFGSDELKRKYLIPAMEGRDVTSVAVSEPDAGSDVAGIKTRARRDGDHWVINGSKMWITNGSQADWICMLVRTSDEGGFQGMSQIIVPTDTPGFSVGRLIEKMGNWSSDTAELVLQDVRVPVSNTIGEVGRGFQQQMVQFQDERLTVSYSAAMGARRALERTVEYLRVREAFGRPLIANQYLRYNIAELMAECDILIEYNRSMAFRYAAGEDVSRMATNAKLKVGKLTRQVADLVVQYHGGMGYAEENWAARYARDSRIIAIGGGADEVMLRVLTAYEGMDRR
ncbi:MAG: acyl-CoA dehydrogenase family protein [Actinobacteria bacterium]|nr:acyl-CoA dehydrogenase family protein [Actinomycetota bacterium]